MCPLFGPRLEASGLPALGFLLPIPTLGHSLANYPLGPDLAITVLGQDLASTALEAIGADNGPIIGPKSNPKPPAKPKVRARDSVWPRDGPVMAPQWPQHGP